MTDLPVVLAASHRDDLLSRVLGRIRLTGERVEIVTCAPGVVLDGDGVPGGCVFVVASGDAVLRGPAEPEVGIGQGELVLLIGGFGARSLAAGAAGAELLLGRFGVDGAILRSMELALPDLVHIDRSQGAAWLDGIARFLRLEAVDDEPGATLMVSRLIDLIVVRTLRTWAHLGADSGAHPGAHPEAHRGAHLGWLSGTADPRIARVLGELHADPSRRWTLDELARVARMSRSSFCDRFAGLVGKPPLRYQNELRLGIAGSLLRDPEARIGKIALQVGYESEAAFSRAYKAMTGRSPAFDRRARAAAADGAVGGG